jgi:hypothetical protein
MISPREHLQTILIIYIFSICILDKPVLVPNKTLLQLKTEILKPASVSLTIKSFEKPDVLWVKSCGGKLSTWFVRETHNKGNNDLQITTQKTKDRATRIQLKTWDEPMCSGKVGSSCSTSGTHRAT